MTCNCDNCSCDNQEKPRSIPMDSMVVEQTRLNDYGCVFVKAHASKVYAGEFEMPDDVEPRRVDHSKVEFDGPSLHFTWLPQWGRAPVAGDFIEVTAKVMSMDNYMEKITA